jgi:hypothetical protein
VGAQAHHRFASAFRDVRRLIRAGTARWLAVLTAGALLALPAAMPAAAQDAGGDGSAARVVLFMPPAEFYPQYTADPLRPQSALAVLWMADSEIPETGAARFALRLGGRFGLVRWHPEGAPDRGWQLDFEGGFFGHFDITESLDNIGWDGLFGLYLSWLPSPELGFRFGTKHDSAHVGDEYAAHTGRERIRYTREELVAGVSWQLDPRWRLYAEGGYGYGLEPGFEPGRLQAGIEHAGARRFWKERATWFAAADAQLFEDRDWRPMVTVQVGFVAPTGRGTNRYRLALEAGTGRSVLGEFSFEDETWVGVGWYFDF